MVDNLFNKTQYEKYADLYLLSNKNGDIGGGSIEQRVNILKNFLPQDRTVFEIGAGSGNDAIALEKAGYNVIASDFVEKFVNEMKKKNLAAIVFDAKHENLPESVDAIYANAVFVHFTPQELQDFIKRAKEKMRNEKLIFMSVIKGEGAERSGRARGIERDFYYYTLSALSELLHKEGCVVEYANDKDPKWLQLICSIR